MHVVLRCPCGANLKADIKFVGREMKCPKCAEKLIVPHPPVAEKSEPEVLELEVVDRGDPSAFQTEATPWSADVLPAAVARPVGVAPAANPRAVTKNKPNANRQRRNVSWILTGSIVAIAVLAFTAVLFVTYQQQRSELANEGKFVYQGGKKVLLESYPSNQPTVVSAPPKEKARPIPPPKKNPFDSGKQELNDPAIKGSDADLAMADLIELVEPSIVRLKVVSDEGERVGSGFFIDREGKIVTNYHVVQGASSITVSTADGKQTNALGFLIAKPEKDLTLIQVDPTQLNIVPTAIASEMPRRGEPVAAFGAPQGFSFSATKGIISSIRSGQEVRDILNEMATADVYQMLGYSIDTTWIQTSTAISGGNSGGPLVNMKGELVGVNTWTHTGGQNLNFASTANEIAEVFRDRTPNLNDFRKLPSKRIRFRPF